MRAIAVLVGLIAVAVAVCSTPDSMPGSFSGMTSDEVGCTVKYGDGSRYVVGPLGPGDSENVEPNDYTLIRLGRTAADLVVAAKFPDSGGNGGFSLNKIPIDGVVVQKGPFRNSGEPGYDVTCWRGNS